MEKNAESQFEKIIQTEMDTLVESDFSGALDVKKISEIVGEKANESNTSTSSVPSKDYSFSGISNKISALLSSQKKVVKKKLPPRTIQKQEVEKAIMKQTQKLVKKATKIQNSKRFSAHQLEEVFSEIRGLRKILASLVSGTVEQIEKLYKKFIWGEV